MAKLDVSHLHRDHGWSRAFPELGGQGLEKYVDASYPIAGSHLRSEANFRNAYPALTSGR
jgi:hypothetical protein